jgi:CheY-like chemotaxis protein
MRIAAGLRQEAAMSSKLQPKAAVLVVDDKPANLLALSAVLEDEHELILASSGEEAIAAVRSRPVDVILMDVQMPGLDGFEAARRIKATAAGKDIPIIFVTAVATEDPSVRKGYESGGIDYFAKPFDPGILKMKVGIYASFRMRGKLLEERERHVREAEELLRVGRKLAGVLESLPVGVLIADVDGRVCQITEEVLRILKAPDVAQSESLGRVLGWWDSAGRMIKDHHGPLAQAIRHGRSAHSESFEVECFDGSRKVVLVSASPLRGLDARLVGAVVLVQDFTESRKIEATLEDRVTRFVSLGVELEESSTR